MTKRAVILVGLISLLVSCQPYMDDQIDQYYGGIFSNIPLYHGDFSSIKDIWSISYWYNNIQYKTTRYIQTPQQTVELGYGDCDCFALLYMNIAYLRFGIKCELVLTDTRRAVVEGGEVNHAVVRLPSGTLINAQNNSLYVGPICYIYSFDEVFNKEN